MASKIKFVTKFHLQLSIIVTSQSINLRAWFVFYLVINSTQTNTSISDVTKVICNGTITIQSHAHNTFIVIYEFIKSK